MEYTGQFVAHFSPEGTRVAFFRRVLSKRHFPNFQCVFMCSREVKRRSQSRELQRETERGEERREGEIYVVIKSRDPPSFLGDSSSVVH